ncbi:efflux RND transporter permease subunit, partial [Oleiphilus sp. HI0117]
LFILYALVSTGWMKFIFFPKVQSELARANLEMPIGTPVEVTDRYVLSMLGAARELQDKYHLEGEAVIRNIMATTGSSGGSSHIGRVIFEITPPEERTLDITSRELVNEWRALIGHVPGAEKLTYRAEIGRVSDPIDIKLSAQDFNALSGIAELIKEKLASYPGVFDISDSYSDGKEAIEIVLLPQASVLGLTRQDIMSQVREAFYGYEVQRIQRGRDDIRVVVRYPKSDRQSIRSLEEFLIRNAQGSAVPLSQVASLRAESTPAVISRLNLKRTISVRADVDKQATNMLVLQQELR